MMQPCDFDPSHPVPVIDIEGCTRCGLCIKVCPNHALVSGEQGNIIVAKPAACDYAGLCEMTCPEEAISRLFIFVRQDDE